MKTHPGIKLKVQIEDDLGYPVAVLDDHKEMRIAMPHEVAFSTLSWLHLIVRAFPYDMSLFAGERSSVVVRLRFRT